MKLLMSSAMKQETSSFGLYPIWLFTSNVFINLYDNEYATSAAS